MQLRPYQSDGINQIAANYQIGIRRQIFQLPTGGGKTYTFSGLIDRYLKAFPTKQVLVCVHREELLKQTRLTLYKGYNIVAEPIVAGMKFVPHAKAYVAMVETLNNWIKKSPSVTKNVGLLIVDECHIGNFKKIYDHFPNALIVGVTATPIASSKKDPLKNYFDEIVEGPSIDDLIMLGSLCENETYSLAGINRKTLSVKRGEFDNREMGEVYSRSKNVQNTVEAYIRLGESKKTMVFNCNVEHSLLVTKAFNDAGFEARHLDGTESKEKRNETLTWFKSNPKAILNSIGVLTTGFDEPSVVNIIMNRSTKSLPLWLQCTGRGSRLFEGKEYFRIIDMGGNALVFGDWRSPRNWHDLFHFPEKPSDGGGVAPIRICEGCEAIVPAQAIICKYCGHVAERQVKYDTIKLEFEQIAGRIDVRNIVDTVDAKNHNPWAGFYKVLDSTLTILKYRLNGSDLTDDLIETAKTSFDEKVKEWCSLTGRAYGRSMREFSSIKFNEKLFATMGMAKVS